MARKTLKNFKITKDSFAVVNGDYFTDANFAIKRNLIKTSSELFNNALQTGLNCKYDNGRLLSEDETTLPDINKLMTSYINSYKIDNDKLEDLNLYRKADNLLQLFYNEDKKLLTQINTVYLDIFRSAAEYLNIKKVTYYETCKLGAVGIFFDNEFVGVIMPCNSRNETLLPYDLKIIKDAGDELTPIDF